MGIRTVATGAVAAVGSAGAAAVGRALGRAPSGWGPPSGSAHTDPGRWRSVTVNRPLDDLAGELPAPLAALGDAVEVRLDPAPGDKGTEIHARLTGATGATGATGPKGTTGTTGNDDPVETLRSALRQAKQVAEVGYVLEADLNTTTKRTPLNEPLRQAIRHAGGSGRS